MQQGFDSEPAAPVDVAISEPPIAPVAVSFDSSPARAAPVPPRESRITPARRLTAWAADAALIGGLFAAHVAAAARVTGRDWGFLLTHAALPWLLLAAVLAFAWSWLFISSSGRTPGMALAGLRVRTAEGKAPRPSRALVRALLAVLFAAPGLFGFLLALFDARGETLHDKLCRCVTVVDAGA